MTAARGAPRPVTLRDFLELGCESSSDGFRAYPRCLPCSDDALQAPVRLLIEADLRRSPSRSSSSSFFLPKSPGPGALARISSLSRSFSRRIREGFWRRRDDDDDEVFFDDRDSCGFPSPLVSSCSASDSGSEYAESEADVVTTEENPASASALECEKASSSSTSSSADHDDRTDAAPRAAGDGPKTLDGKPVGRDLEMEDKQQLSPVSVLDFPFDDEDGEEGSDAGTCSPSFQRCPADLQRTKAQLLHKIRRYDGLAEAVDPVDLRARFTASESGGDQSVDACTRLASSSCTDTATTTTAPCHDEEHQSTEQEDDQELDEHCLLDQLLKDTPASVAVDEISEVLLLDFFAEGIDRVGSIMAAGTVKPLEDRRLATLVGAARDWLQGAGPQWGIGDVMFSGEAALADMERGRRWMCVGEEEQDVGAAVEGLVMNGLVDELVTELVPCWYRWN